MPGSEYRIVQHANDYIPVLRDCLDNLYAELKGYEEEQDAFDDLDYSLEIAELRGKCWALAWAIANFYMPENPDKSLSEVRMSTHQRWLESNESDS